MKLLLKEPVWSAVNGLWLSGLYAVAPVSVAGLMYGAVTGVILMLSTALANRQEFTVGVFFLLAYLGTQVGALCGVLFGAIVGLPAGILSSGLRGRQGYRFGTALVGFGLGSVIVCFPLRWMLGQAVDGWEQCHPILLLLVLLVLTLVCYGIGNHLYTRLENSHSSDGLFARWYHILQESGLDELTFKDRTVALAIALTPIVFTYGYIPVSLAIEDAF